MKEFYCLFIGNDKYYFKKKPDIDLFFGFKYTDLEVKRNELVRKQNSETVDKLPLKRKQEYEKIYFKGLADSFISKIPAKTKKNYPEIENHIRSIIYHGIRDIYVETYAFII